MCNWTSPCIQEWKFVQKTLIVYTKIHIRDVHCVHDTSFFPFKGYTWWILTTIYVYEFSRTKLEKIKAKTVADSILHIFIIDP